MHLFIFLFLGLLLLIVQFKLSSVDKKPQIVISKQQSALLLNDDFLNYINLGQKRLISSIIWIETLMESDLEHYTNNDLNSWMFLRFSSLTKIDPHFYEVYRYGGLYLSIVKDDAIGADIIYKRGLKIFPNDYQLNMNFAFNSYFELGNVDNAIIGYEKALKAYPKKNTYLPTLLLKLKTKQRGVVDETIYSSLLAQYNKLDDQQKKSSRLKNDLYAIRAEIDLECLNSNKNICNRYDFFGNQYIEEQGNFTTELIFKKFRIKEKAQ